MIESGKMDESKLEAAQEDFLRRQYEELTTCEHGRAYAKLMESKQPQGYM